MHLFANRSTILRPGHFHLQKELSNCWPTTHQHTEGTEGPHDSKRGRRTSGAVWEAREAKSRRSWSHRNEMESLVREGGNNMNL